VLFLQPEFTTFAVNFGMFIVTASFTIFFEFDASLGISSTVNFKLQLFADSLHRQ
jgi:hypothetical protein